MKNIKEILVEAIGTFFLCFVGGLAVYNANNDNSESLINVAFAHGLVLFVMICWGGPLTGAQYNPALTIALMVNNEHAVKEGAMHILSQTVGSLVAGLMLWIVLPNPNRDNKNYYTSPTLSPIIAQYQGFLLEYIATFTLVMLIFTGIRTKQKEQMIACYVGATLMAFINAMGPFTGASLNPARTFGPFLFCNGFMPFDSIIQPFAVYYLAPILGGITGGFLSKFIIHNETTLGKMGTKKSN